MFFNSVVEIILYLFCHTYPYQRACQLRIRCCSPADQQIRRRFCLILTKIKIQSFSETKVKTQR